MKLVTSRVRKISGTIAAVSLLSFVAMPSFQAQDVAQDTQSAPLGSAAMQQLVAPIALYPDALIAQVLAASTYPDQIVEADRWLQEHSKWTGDKLASEVDKQPWDPSIKALTGFSSVLANLDKDLSWTSSLGDAYFNQQQDVICLLYTSPSPRD